MEDFEKFYNKALRFLSYRPRSEKEVRDKLLRFVKKNNKKRATAEAQKGTETQKNKFNVSDKFSASVVAIEIPIIDKVIQKLKEQKFINDEEFAKWWIESRLRFRPRSINLIKRELLQKGVDRELIDAQISNLKSQISNELENAQKLIEKKIKRYKNLSKQEIYQKLGGFLARRGFDWDTIKQVIDPD